MKIDQITDKVSEWLGSVRFMAVFTLLMVVWLSVGKKLDSDYAVLTVFLSILAIYMTSIIERSTTKLNEALLKFTKQAEKAAKEDLAATERLERKVDKYGLALQKSKQKKR